VKRREEEKVYALYVAGLQLEREKRSRLRKRLEHNILRASKQGSERLHIVMHVT
jgi:hypothetical protein